MKTRSLMILAALAMPMSGCATSGMASAMAQNVAGNAISNAQEKAANERRLKAVMAEAEANSRQPGDSELTCDAIGVEMIQQAQLIADSAENLGIDVDDYSSGVALQSAALQAASMSGIAQAVPVAGVASSMARQQAQAEREKMRDEAEVQFHSARVRNEVLTEYLVDKSCS